MQQRVVDIGGRRLAVTTSGQGSITVVLETGLGAESCEWAEVQKGVASVASVLSYDRANRGDSDPAPRPRRASCVAKPEATAPELETSSPRR